MATGGDVRVQTGSPGMNLLEQMPTHHLGGHLISLKDKDQRRVTKFALVGGCLHRFKLLASRFVGTQVFEQSLFLGLWHQVRMSLRRSGREWCCAEGCEQDQENESGLSQITHGHDGA